MTKTTTSFSFLAETYSYANAALVMSGKMSMAEAFDKVFGEDTENNGWCGRSLTRYPLPNEAKELDGEHFSSSWGWVFQDGSELYLTYGQVSSTVSTTRGF